MRNVVIVLITTFVLIFPQFILQSHPSFANILSVGLAVIVNLAFVVKA